jgi:hypothetical protein
MAVPNNSDNERITKFKLPPALLRAVRNVTSPVNLLLLKRRKINTTLTAHTHACAQSSSIDGSLLFPPNTSPLMLSSLPVPYLQNQRHKTQRRMKPLYLSNKDHVEILAVKLKASISSFGSRR